MSRLPAWILAALVPLLGIAAARPAPAEEAGASEPLAKHPYFERWTDPETGVESYILTRRAAPVQKAFYYLTPSISADGKWLWFHASFPPSLQWMLAAVSLDPASPRLRLFQQTAGEGGPRVAPEGDAAYVAIRDGIYRQPVDGEIQTIFRMPPDVLQNRHLFSLVTELTVSADGTHFVLDSRIGNRWLLSLVEIKTGELTPLRWFGTCHHHAQFSPVDPTLILLGQGPYRDPMTGDKFDMNIRMWVMDTKLSRYEPVQADLWFNRNSKSCHEWWGPDGRIFWVDYDDGLYECTLADRKRTLFWKHVLLCHAHCDKTLRYYCGDVNPYTWTPEKPCRVFFFDRQTGREIAIASALPVPTMPPRDWRAYHTDPHPHFSPDGRYVIYTTTARGALDVAVAPVAGICQRLDKAGAPARPK